MKWKKMLENYEEAKVGEEGVYDRVHTLGASG